MFDPTNTLHTTAKPGAERKAAFDAYQAYHPHMLQCKSEKRRVKSSLESSRLYVGDIATLMLHLRNLSLNGACMNLSGSKQID